MMLKERYRMMTGMINKDILTGIMSWLFFLLFFFAWYLDNVGFMLFCLMCCVLFKIEYYAGGEG